MKRKRSNMSFTVESNGIAEDINPITPFISKEAEPESVNTLDKTQLIYPDGFELGSFTIPSCYKYGENISSTKLEYIINRQAKGSDHEEFNYRQKLEGILKNITDYASKQFENITRTNNDILQFKSCVSIITFAISPITPL